MDPLSITASTITLISAANNIYRFLSSIRDADTWFDALCAELASLTDLLRSIDRTLGDCRSNALALTRIDKDLWSQSNIALEDCQNTLGELQTMVDRMKIPARPNTFFRRAKVATEMHRHSREITAFREKIRMSSWSLQTLLQVINVSLSLENNTSQERTMRELMELKGYLERSYRAATDSIFITDFDLRAIRNLKGLIRAARDFHASASTAATTIHGSQRHHLTPFGEDGGAASIVAPRIPSVKRRHIETFLKGNQQPTRANSLSLPALPSPEESGGLVDARHGDYPQDPEVVSRQTLASLSGSRRAMKIALKGRLPMDVDSLLSVGLTKMAQSAIRELDFRQAEKILRQALQYHRTSGVDDTHHRHLRVQLALSQFLQGSGLKAEDLILDLVEFRTNGDEVNRLLLFALALAHIHELESEATQRICERLLQTQHTTSSHGVPGQIEIIQLLAISYRLSGQELLAGALEVGFASVKTLGPLPSVVQFILGSGILLLELFGLEDLSEVPQQVIEQMKSLPVATKESAFQQYELNRTGGLSDGSATSETDGYADDEASQFTTEDFEKRPTHLADSLRTSLTRLKTRLSIRQPASDMDRFTTSTEDVEPVGDDSRPKRAKLQRKNGQPVRQDKSLGNDYAAPKLPSRWNFVTMLRRRSSAEPEEESNRDQGGRVLEWIRGQGDRDETHVNPRRRFSFDQPVRAPTPICCDTNSIPEADGRPIIPELHGVGLTPFEIINRGSRVSPQPFVISTFRSLSQYSRASISRISAPSPDEQGRENDDNDHALQRSFSFQRTPEILTRPLVHSIPGQKQTFDGGSRHSGEEGHTEVTIDPASQQRCGSTGSSIMRRRKANFLPSSSGKRQICRSISRPTSSNSRGPPGQQRTDASKAGSDSGYETGGIEGALGVDPRQRPWNRPSNISHEKFRTDDLDILFALPSAHEATPRAADLSRSNAPVLCRDFIDPGPTCIEACFELDDTSKTRKEMGPMARIGGAIIRVRAQRIQNVELIRARRPGNGLDGNED